MMNFALSEEHLQIQDLAATFAREQLAPFADSWDEQAYFPVDTLREAAALGMAGIVAPGDIWGAPPKPFFCGNFFLKITAWWVSPRCFFFLPYIGGFFNFP